MVTSNQTAPASEPLQLSNQRYNFKKIHKEEENFGPNINGGKFASPRKYDDCVF